MPAIIGVYHEEAIAVSTAAVALDPSPGSAAAKLSPLAVEIDVRANSIRVRMDGTDPTATVGDLREAQDRFFIVDRQSIQKFRAIRESADATIWVRYGMGYTP